MTPGVSEADSACVFR